MTTSEHKIERLLALASNELREPGQANGYDHGPYVVVGGRICYRKRSPDGDVAIPLCNFAAHVKSEVDRDDGTEVLRVWEIEGTLDTGQPLPAVVVPTGQVASMNWVVSGWGVKAVIGAGIGAKDRLREALQLLSPQVERRTEFEHTGWRNINGVTCYLNAGVCIGAAGSVTGVTVVLRGGLTRYALPSPPDGEERGEAIAASLRLLTTGPLGIMAPLMGAVYLAPLRHLLQSEPPDFVVWLLGLSGVFKTEVGTLGLAHFGPFTRATLPASFQDTGNGLERILHDAKDALVVVDDFHPAHNPREASAMASTATRLARSVGNNAGRRRMRADTSTRPSLSPRCIVVATGERLPEGNSTNARMMVVPMAEGDINSAWLNNAQRESALFPEAMASYIQWIAQHFQDLSEQLTARFRELRIAAQAPGFHAREPGQIAYLFLALETFTEFATTVGVVSEEERRELLRKTWAVLLGLAAEQGSELANDSPVQRFLALLRDGLASHSAYLSDDCGQAPVDAEVWGWEVREYRNAFGETERQARHGPNAKLLGVLTQYSLLLYPETTYQFVASAARAAGQLFPVELRTLLRHLADEELIVVEPGTGRRTPRVRLGSDQQLRVIKLRRDAIEDTYGASYWSAWVTWVTRVSQCCFRFSCDPKPET